MDLPIIAPALLMAIVYTWAQLNQNQIVSFFFGIKVKAQYFPWALLLLDVLTGAPIMMNLVGIFVGHLLYFLQHIYPAASGMHLLPQTPQLVNQWFAQGAGSNIRGFTASAPAGRAGGAATGGTGHRWGRGSALGGR